MDGSLHFTNRSKYYLSEGQIRHFYYCLSRIGFQDGIIQTSFVERLYQAVCNEFKNYKAESKDGKTGWIDYYPYGDREFMSIVYNKVINEVSFKKANLIDDEIMDAPILFYIKKELGLQYVSATDISSFVYCPASYCIKKSFVEAEVSEETKEGTELHESNRLLLYASGEKREYKFSDNVIGDSLITKENKDFFDDIRSSKVYYAGHVQQTKRYFKSSKGNFFGQPDYVFTNSSGVKYIVEEKFRRIGKEVKEMRANHRAQLASYINGIDELSANYGYLVYWYYTYEDDVRKVKKCTVFKVEKSLKDKMLLREIYQSVVELGEGLALDFDVESLDAAKCANCVVRKFCGHKTGRFSDISIPYGKEYYGLVR